MRGVCEGGRGYDQGVQFYRICFGDVKGEGQYDYIYMYEREILFFLVLYFVISFVFIYVQLGILEQRFKCYFI